MSDDTYPYQFTGLTEYQEYQLLISTDKNEFILAFPDGEMAMAVCQELIESPETHPLYVYGEGRLVHWILSCIERIV